MAHLGGHEKKCGIRANFGLKDDGEEAKEHDHQFQYFGKNDDGSFADPVGKTPAPEEKRRNGMTKIAPAIDK